MRLIQVASLVELTIRTPYEREDMMSTPTTQESSMDSIATRRSPLLNGQGFKLVLFAFNLRGGLSTTTAKGAHYPTWENNVRLAQMADGAGFEAIIPVCRWKGFGGRSDYHGTSFETITWAAGLAGVTNYSTLVATAHVPTIHPILAAKQATTVDHISGGRFAFNIVAGWYAAELEMFGGSLDEHGERYARCAEWMDFVKKLWIDTDEFDLQGRFYSARKVSASPKPIQKPCPVIISAAGSPRGLAFAGQHADVVFTTSPTIEEMAVQVPSLRQRIWDQFNREVTVLACVTIMCRPTEREARDCWDHCVRVSGDRVAAENWIRTMSSQSRLHSERRFTELIREQLDLVVAGQATPQVVGTPEQVVEYMSRLSDIGVDGATISFITNWESELVYFIDEVMPLMEHNRLRTPFIRASERADV